MKGIKANDLDTFILKLLEYNQNEEVYMDEFCKNKLPDWSPIKVRGCYLYLIENYGDMLEIGELDRLHNILTISMGVHKKTWEDTIEKGGFTAYWKEREDALKQIKGYLDTSNVGITLTKHLMSLITNFF